MCSVAGQLAAAAVALKPEGDVSVAGCAVPLQVCTLTLCKVVCEYVQRPAQCPVNMYLIVG